MNYAQDVNQNKHEKLKCNITPDMKNHLKPLLDEEMFPPSNAVALVLGKEVQQRRSTVPKWTKLSEKGSEQED